MTDRNLVPLGDPLHSWSGLSLVGRFNEPGTGTVSIPAHPDMAALIQPGNRMVAIRHPAPALGIPGSVLMAGPIERPAGPWDWEAAGADTGGRGRLTLFWTEDEALIAGRDAFPVPAQPATNQTASAYWTYSGNAELAMRALVNQNAGPGALSARQIPQLELGALASVGTDILVRTRMEPLGDVLRSAAIAGGGLGYRTRQVGREIHFEVYQPADRSREIYFSRGLRNLQAVKFEHEGPTATHVFVAGQGEGTARTIREVADTAAAAAWWRVEKFLDQRQTNVAAELDQAGAEALAAGGPSVKITTVTVDTPDQRYGVHFGLGDRVSVALYEGVPPVSEVVRGYQLTADPKSGELTTLLIGSQDATRDPTWLRVGRDLQRRLGNIERR